MASGYLVFSALADDIPAPSASGTTVAPAATASDATAVSTGTNAPNETGDPDVVAKVGDTEIKIEDIRATLDSWIPSTAETNPPVPL